MDAQEVEQALNRLVQHSENTVRNTVNYGVGLTALGVTQAVRKAPVLNVIVDKENLQKFLAAAPDIKCKVIQRKDGNFQLRFNLSEAKNMRRVFNNYQLEKKMGIKEANKTIRQEHRQERAENRVQRKTERLNKFQQKEGSITFNSADGQKVKSPQVRRENRKAEKALSKTLQNGTMKQGGVPMPGKLSDKVGGPGVTNSIIRQTAKAAGKAVKDMAKDSMDMEK